MFMCSTDSLTIDLAIGVWMSSIRSDFNRLFDFYENLPFNYLSKFHYFVNKWRLFEQSHIIQSIIESSTETYFWPF
jgi:hypothetical protein